MNKLRLLLAVAAPVRAQVAAAGTLHRKIISLRMYHLRDLPVPAAMYPTRQLNKLYLSLLPL